MSWIIAWNIVGYFVFFLSCRVMSQKFELMDFNSKPLINTLVFIVTLLHRLHWDSSSLFIFILFIDFTVKFLCWFVHDSFKIGVFFRLDRLLVCVCHQVIGASLFGKSSSSSRFYFCKLSIFSFYSSIILDSIDFSLLFFVFLHIHHASTQSTCSHSTSTTWFRFCCFRI